MKKKPTSTKSKTDFARLDKMKDEDIDLFRRSRNYARNVRKVHCAARSKTAHKNAIDFARG